jgi:hypothetical protein
LDAENVELYLQDFQKKISINKLNTNSIKRGEELNTLDELKNKRDPNKLYKTQFAKEDEPMQPDLGGMKGQNLQPLRTTQYLKPPVLLEDAKVTLQRDKELLLKAGGYSQESLYKELSSYAKFGLLN